MSQPYGKLMPNLDRQSTKVLNLTVLRRIDPFVEEILMTAAHVAFYEFNVDLCRWSRKDVEGSLFVVKRNTQPRFQFIVMNRRSTDNLVEDILGDFEYEVQDKYLLYRNASQEIKGVWFYDSHELQEVANLFNRILAAYSKVPQKSKVTSAKGEFEEMEAVSTSVDGPLEPPLSTVSNATGVPDNPSFLNFLNTSMTVGNASNAGVSGQTYKSLAATPATVASNPAIVASSAVPALQLQSCLSSSTPLMPLLDTPESSTNHTNLVMPSSFFVPLTSSAQTLVPVSTSLPTAPLPNTSLTLQHTHGTSMLQSFLPPTPSQSLTPPPVPIQNYGLTISRENVRHALMALVQDNQFIDMVHGALLNAHHPHHQNWK